jgi:hypothetical protein
MEPITTYEQLEALDQDLIVTGYRAGLKTQPDYTQRDQAYWHGYMNGQVDCGAMPGSPEQAQLARACVAAGERFWVRAKA